MDLKIKKELLANIPTKSPTSEVTVQGSA